MIIVYFKPGVNVFLKIFYIVIALAVFGVSGMLAEKKLSV